MVLVSPGNKLKYPSEKYTDSQVKEFFGENLDRIEIAKIQEEIKKDLPKLYWKVRMSFDDDTEDLIIDETEIAKAYYIFTKKIDAVFSVGAIRGKDIISILPDYASSLGWNRGYTPTPEDWNYLNNSKTTKYLRDKSEELKYLCLESQSLQELENKFLLDDRYLLN